MSRKRTSSRGFVAAISRLAGRDRGILGGSGWAVEPLEARTLLSFGDFDRRLLASDAAAFDQFGQAVAVSGDVIATGAHGADLFTGPAQTRNAADEFSTSSNPNGPWRYGWRPDNTNAFLAFDQVGAVPGSSSLGWTSAALGVTPSVWKNTATPIYGTTPGELVFHPGVSTESVVRYTASGRGEAFVRGSFGTGDFGTVNVKIVVDGVTQFSQTSVTDNTPFDLRLILSAGSTIDFVINAAGDISGDNTPLDASVIFTPGAVDAGAVYLHNALTGQQLRKLTASDGDPGDYFGIGVAMDGNRVLVGARDDDQAGLDAGAAYLFDATTGSQLFKLMPGANRVGAYFGASVDLNGSFVVVGAPYAGDPGFRSGAVSVFDANTGAFLRELAPNDGGDQDGFGHSVAIFGDFAIVGSPYSDNERGTNAGSAYVFNVRTGDLIRKFLPSDASSSGRGFGWSVDLEGNVAIIGGTNTSNEAAYVVNTQTGEQLARLSDPDGPVGAFFGSSVAISGNYAFVGSRFAFAAPAVQAGAIFQFMIVAGNQPGKQIAKFVRDVPTAGDQLGAAIAANDRHLVVGNLSIDTAAGVDAGAVHVRASKPNESTADVGYLVNEIDASDGVAGDEFGSAVSSSGDWVLIGSPSDDHNPLNLVNAGSAWLVNRVSGSRTKLLPYGDQTAFDYFGLSVAISGDFAVVGSPLDDDYGTNSGSAYVFSVTTGAVLAKLRAPDGAANDQFGYSVAISGHWILVGANGDDDSRGSAWLFNIQTGQQRKLVAFDGTTNPPFGDSFGWSVAISGDLAIVGAVFDDDRGTDSGSAYVFSVSTGTLLAKLLAPDGGHFDNFGISVAISGERAIIGAAGRDDYRENIGAAYVFNARTGMLQYKVIAPDPAAGDVFGSKVSISEDLILVGAPNDDDRGFESGSAYVFASATGAFLQKLTASNGAAGDRFGYSVAVSGSTLVAGMPFDSGRGLSSGTVWYTGTGSLRIDPVSVAGPLMWTSTSPSLANPPKAWINTGSPVYGIANGELALHSGTGSEAVARFTSPSAGAATISGTFGEGHFGAVTVSVLVDGVVHFSQSSATGNASFNFTQGVSVGSTIDFVVNAAGDVGGDSTPLSASISINGQAQPSAAAAFSPTANPNQSWQFGWRYEGLGSFTPFDVVLPIPIPDDGVIGGTPILVPNTSTRIGTSAIVNEGGIARFKITRDSLLYRPLRVYFNILGEASADDFQGGVLASGSVEIPQGQASITVEIPINADGRADIENQFQNERLTIVLDTDSRDGSQYTQDGDPTGDLVRDGQNRWVPRPGGVVGLRHIVAQDAWTATWEIVDLDAKYVKIETTNATGGELSQDSVEFTLTRGGDLSQPLTVDVDLTGTALVDVDYTLAMLSGESFVRSGTTVSITIPANRASVVITALPINDNLNEGIEWIHAELINRPGVYTLTTDPERQQSRVSLIDDDIPSVLVRAVQSDVTEGGTMPLQFQLARGSLYGSLPLTVNLALDGLGSTASRLDYDVRLGSPTGPIVTPSPGSGLYEVPLLANQSQVNVFVVPVDDTVAERDEKINVRLIGGNYLPHPTLTSVELVIREDPNDQAVVSIEAVDPWAGETNRASGQFVLRRSGGVLSDALTVSVSVLGSAYYGIDWTSPNLSLNAPSVVTFAPGQAETAVNVVPLDDSLSEDTETVTLTVQQAGPYRTSSEVASTATVFVTDFAGGGGTKAQWTWSMPDRYGVDRNNDGRVDVPNTQAYANPTNGFDVRFDAGESTSGAGMLSYLWTIANQAGVVQFTQTLSAFTAQLFEQIYVVSLRVTDQLMIMSEQTQLVEVNDILIVSAGDSVAAGEGNPVIRRFNVLETLFGGPPIPLLGGNNPLPLGWWADDGIGATPDDPYSLVEGSVEYDHAAAHRSTLAASSLTAMEIERRDPRSSVTFVFVAQTGASITDGILNPKVDGADNRYDNDSEERPFPNLELADGEGDTRRFGRSQLAEISHLIGNRTIDAMTMSVGANDIGFSDILTEYVKRYHYRAAIFFTGESKALDEIRDELRRRIARLPSLYADLDGGIQATLGNNLSSASNLVIQGYFDPTGNSNGVPANVLQDSVAGSLTGLFLTGFAGLWNPFYYITDTPLRIDAEESAHGRQHAVIPLNREVGRASSQFGWTYIAAPSGFLTRGYSASESWIRSATDSRIYQGGEAWLKPWGAVHPNEPGQAAYSNSQLATFLGDDRPVPSFAGLVGGVVRVTEGQSALVSVTDGRVRRVGGLTYQWDLDYDGSSFSPDPSITGSSATISAVGKRYPASGKIAVRATDQLGRSSFAVVDVAVVNGTAGRTPNEVRTVDVDEPFRLTLERTSASTDPAFSWRIAWSDGYSENVPADWLYRSRVFTAPGMYTYSVFLTDAGGEIAVDTGSVFAISNDPFPTVSVLPPLASATEGSGSPLRFQFVRSGSLARSLSISIDFATGVGRAVNGVDFTAIDGSMVPLSIFFAAGSNTAFVDVVARGDADESEGTETIDLSINPSSLYAIGQGTATPPAVILDAPSNERGRIEGLVFDDANGDGIRGIGEELLAGRHVGIDLNNDNVIGLDEPIAITGTDGRYTHPSLLAGSYRLLLLGAAGWVSTGPDRRTAMLTPAVTLSGQDFSVARPVIVTGRVFRDDDIDGQQSGAEDGRSGVLVFVDRNVNGEFDPDEPSVATGPDGSYTLADVAPGQQFIRAQTAAGWTGTNGVDGGAIAISAEGGASVANVNHGQRRTAPTIVALGSSVSSVSSGGAVSLTAQGVDPWTSRVLFYRESNGVPGLQTDTPGHANDDTLIGMDGISGDGWSLTLDAGLFAGSYSFYALADDGTGVTSQSPAETVVEVVGEPAPTVVGVRRLTTVVREGGRLAAAFEVFRTGFNANALAVNVGVQGGQGFVTAGDDIEAVGPSIVIPAGRNSAILVVRVLDDGVAESNETLRVGVLAGDGYALGTQQQADVSIVDSSTTPDVISIVAASLDTTAGASVVRVGFDESTSDSLTTADVTLLNVTTGVVYNSSQVVVLRNLISGVMELYVPAEGGNTGVLPAGEYRLTINGAGVTNEIGHILDGNGDGVGGGDFVFSFIVGAAPVSTWDGDAGTSDWNDPLNWTGNTLPGPTSSVEIPAGFVVNLGQASVSVGTLTVHGTLGINAATLEVVGSLSIIGSVTVNASSLLVGGSIENGGVLVLSPTAVVTAGGDYTQTATGALTTQVGAGGVSATLVAAGSLNLGGTLNLQHVEGFDPTFGFPEVRITSVQGSTRVGNFASISLAATVVGSYSYHLLDDGIEIVWNFADFDGSEGVDGDDVIAFLTLWDQGNSLADVNGDGGVDGDDLIAFFGLWDNGGR